MKLNPFKSVLIFLGYVIKGKIRFPKDKIGQIYEDRGQSFTIFRQAIVAPSANQPEIPGAQIKIRFHLAKTTPEQDRIYSLFSIPLFVGFPGFRTKLWMYSKETGDMQGVYEWDTVEDAGNYAGSIAMKFIKKRSVPGSVSVTITPKQTEG